MLHTWPEPFRSSWLRAWDADKESPSYNKREWRELEGQLSILFRPSPGFSVDREVCKGILDSMARRGVTLELVNVAAQYLDVERP